MRWIPFLVLLALTSVTGLGCGGGGSGPTSGTEPGPGDDIPQNENWEPGALVNDPRSLHDAVEVDGSVRFVGSIPSPAGATGGTIAVSSEKLVVTSNSAFEFEIDVTPPPGGHVEAYVLQIEGVDEFFLIPVDESGNATLAKSGAGGSAYAQCATGNPPCGSFSMRPSGSIRATGGGYAANMRVQAFGSAIPAGVPDISGLFDRMRGDRDPSHWTPPTTVQVEVVPVLVGDPQISLTWDGPIDLDLRVIEPGGNLIYYGDKVSDVSSGELDTDNTEGYGPENIAFPEPPPEGTYRVEVDYYSISTRPVRYTVVVTNGGQRTVYEGTLAGPGPEKVVTTFQVGPPRQPEGFVRGNVSVAVVSTGNAETAVTIYTTTTAAHIGPFFSVGITIDGVPRGGLTARSSSPPASCDLGVVTLQRKQFALAPGTHTIRGKIDAYDLFGWPEIQWETTVTLSAGDCVRVGFND